MNTGYSPSNQEKKAVNPSLRKYMDKFNNTYHNLNTGQQKNTDRILFTNYNVT